MARVDTREEARKLLGVVRVHTRDSRLDFGERVQGLPPGGGRRVAGRR
jgi:hypothetical protein